MRHHPMTLVLARGLSGPIYATKRGDRYRIFPVMREDVNYFIQVQNRSLNLTCNLPALGRRAVSHIASCRRNYSGLSWGNLFYCANFVHPSPPHPAYKSQEISKRSLQKKKKKKRKKKKTTPAQASKKNTILKVLPPPLPPRMYLSKLLAAPSCKKKN